ncbi:MAG TPA: hypothetical protein VJ917_04920 [Saprospiraceae bacterium]|nr:hypothetical protein [Saprospiraceae bacterium]
MNFDRNIKEKMEGMGVPHAGEDWSKMESMLDDFMPPVVVSEFDQNIKDKITQVKGATQPDWSRMSQALDNELGFENHSFDDLIAARVLQFNPGKNANWDKMSRALDQDVQPGKSVHLFDRQIKRALAGLVATAQPRWKDMSFALDADPVLGDPQAFDARVKEEVEHTNGPGTAANSWPRMEQQLQMQELRRRRILRSKFAELAAVLLLLLSFPGLFTLLNQGSEEQVVSSTPETVLEKENGTNPSFSESVETKELSEEVISSVDNQAVAPARQDSKEELGGSAASISSTISTGGIDQISGTTAGAQVMGESSEMAAPYITNDAESEEQGDQEITKAKAFEPLAFMMHTGLDTEQTPATLSAYRAVNSDKQRNLRMAPIVYVSAQAQFRHNEVLVSGFNGDNKLIYHNQIQPGLAVGLTTGIWDLELGALPFQIEHEGLPGQHTFVDYPNEEATYRREYLSSDVRGWIVPLRGRFHMPVSDRLSMHALAGLSGTFLTESEQVFQEQFHDWIEEEPQGGDNRPDRVVRITDNNFFLDAELGLGLNYQLNPRWRVFAEGSTFIPLEGTRTIGENADEYSQYGLSFGVQFLLK